MAQKIPIVIYEIPLSALNTFNKEILAQKNNSDYLIGVDTRDIITRVVSNSTLLIPFVQQIYITSQNFPSVDNIPSSVEGYYTVKERNNDFYITLNSKNYYIYNPTVNTQSSLLDQGGVAYTFYVNPDRITPIYQKLQTEVRTLGGWEVQHWGNQLVELRVDGKTGGMHTKIVNGIKVKLGPNDSIMDSEGWKKLVQLRRIYERDQARRNKQPTSLLALNYLDGLYVGYFTSFTGPVAEMEKPYLMIFNFTFKVQEIVYSSGDISIPGDKQEVR